MNVGHIWPVVAGSRTSCTIDRNRDPARRYEEYLVLLFSANADFEFLGHLLKAEEWLLLNTRAYYHVYCRQDMHGTSEIYLYHEGTMRS